MLSDRLAKELARTLVKQSSGGLTDQQVDSFLALYEQQVPDSIKEDPKELQHLLDESKQIARELDDYDMPSISVTVQDFRFSPPSISAELPCTLQFRLLPHSSRQQITVLDSSSGQRVASSGLLRGGDCFTATICDPGAYTFTSEVYPFMSGTLTAAASSVAVVAGGEDAAPATAGQEAKGAAATAAGGAAVASDAGGGAAAVYRCADAGDGFVQQPTERAMLELLSSTAATQADVPAFRGTCSTADSGLPDLSRAGRWARRATAYDDEADAAPHGLEGLTLSPEPLPGPTATTAGAAALPRPSSPTWAAAGRGRQQGTSAASASAELAEEAAAASLPRYSAGDASDVSEMQAAEYGDDGCGWYERLRSDSDHSSGSSSDDDEHQQQGAAGGAQHRLGRRQNSEAAHLLGDDGGVQPQRRRLPAWGCSASSSFDGEAPSPTSSSSSLEAAASDVRLRSLHGRGAAAHAAALQRCSAEDADEVLLVEDMEEYGPYELLAGCNASAAAEPAAAHTAAAAGLQPRMLGGAARAGTAEAAAQTLPPLRNRAGLLQQPPGSSWSLGGSALGVGGGVRSTFSSTNHAPLAGSSSRYAAGADVDHEQSNSAAPAAGRPTYYVRLTSSRTHVGLEASGQVVSSSSGGGSTLLGPGTHLISQQALRQRSTSSSLGGAQSRVVGAGSIDDPVEQLEQLHRDKARRLRQHHLQLRQAADSDGNESPPELSVRLAQKRQQQLTAASTVEPSGAAAAGSAAGKACGKKKKGRSKAAAGLGSERAAASEAAAVSRAAAAAAAERRRERDHLECALYDHGSGSSRADSEDEASATQAMAAGATPASAVAAAHAAAGGAKQLSKCKHKACKLEFSTELNKHRCHMSHLPSARNATTKTYKAEVLAFVRALPPAALAQLLRLPEPASLPRRRGPQTLQGSQQQQQSKPGKASSAAVEAASATAASIQRLQSSALSDAWLKASSCAAADGAGWSPEAVMASISSGLDVLDVLGEWGVTDAALSYAVERRLVTAFHRAKEAEARRIMSQLLDEDAPTGAAAAVPAAARRAADTAGSGSQAQQQGTGSAAGAARAGSAKAAKKKDKRKAGKAAKLPASAAAKKIPAWKDVSSDRQQQPQDDPEALQLQFGSFPAEFAFSPGGGILRVDCNVGVWVGVRARALYLPRMVAGTESPLVCLTIVFGN
ncbi:hypothetical protein OEZ85_010040 [Tetradesmus obliquus]|uniref:C2H2-type domain-containing protein n=1 Tax=Tetradesmus obliquus TaxID=3088 RepID=A0ABY8UBB3_TETOB|nr:hypothetical protein OEZ85_010040 [Tetradesmus obliquus]